MAGFGNPKYNTLYAEYRECKYDEKSVANTPEIAMVQATELFNYDEPHQQSKPFRTAEHAFIAFRGSGVSLPLTTRMIYRCFYPDTQLGVDDVSTAAMMRILVDKKIVNESVFCDFD